MNKKVNISKQEIDIKIDKDTTIGNTKFKADQKLKVKIKEAKETELPKEDGGTIQVEATIVGKKEGDDGDQTEDKKIDVVYVRGYFKNGLVIKKLGGEELKESKQLMSTGGDYFFNLAG
jgi:hypothetical protein